MINQTIQTTIGEKNFASTLSDSQATVNSDYQAAGRQISENIIIGEASFLSEVYSTQFRIKMEQTPTGFEVYIGSEDLTNHIRVTRNNEDGLIEIFANGELNGHLTQDGIVID